MANKIKINSEDANDFYDPSDSDGEYTAREKLLLKKVRKNNRTKDASDEELLAFDDDDDAAGEDDFGEYQDNSDFDDEERKNSGIPDARAWGKKRKDFYSTDFVDQDYSSYNATEEQLAEQEESEARAIQQRLAKQLEEADFTLDVYSSTSHTNDGSNKIGAKTELKTDLSDLGYREKIQMFRKDSPEFDGLVQDFEQRLEESQDVLEPILDYFKLKNILNVPIVNFVLIRNNLILSYCSNVAFYLVLKAKRISIKNHPLVKRLVQMRQLLLQLDNQYERVVKPQIQNILSHIEKGEELTFQTDTLKTKKSSKLLILTSMKMADNKESESEPADHEESVEDSAAGIVDSDSDIEGDDGMETNAIDERRQITYQMSKNKGLTPHRKKELRNPRVKHRNKFRKAIIRRKGAVRTVRKEVTRYSGEISGIKASTKKGIKIK